MRTRAAVTFLCLTLLALLWAPASADSPADRAQQKFRHIQSNGARRRPDPKPTVLTEEEINAYLASGRVQLPKGVKKVRFSGQPGRIYAVARVDFDEITAGKRSANPLLYLFTGTHDIEAEARARGRAHQAVLEVESVKLDGVTIPRAALEFFLDRFVRPKYPQAGMSSRFKMPHRIESAQVGDKILTVTQR